MKNLFNTVNQKVLGLTTLALTASLASAGPVADAAGAIDMGDVLTAVGTIGVAVIGIVVAIKGIKFLRSAL